MSCMIQSPWRAAVLCLAALLAQGAAAQGGRGAQTTFDSAQAPADSALKVLRAVPEGKQVPSAGRQIVITFDRPVVPLGITSVTAAAVDVAPAVNCQWHWLDPRSLACEMNEKQALVPATQYTVTVQAGITAQDGSRLMSSYQWVFSTERPAIKEYSFRTWRGPGIPMVRLVFNQPVTQESVQTALHFSNQAGVIAAPDPYFSEVFFALPLPGEPAALIFPRGTPSYQSAARRVWLVQPSRELPSDTTVQLAVIPGLRGYAGPLLGKEKRTIVEFDTFPPFRFLGVRCLVDARSTLIGIDEPASPKQPACNPLATVSLAFSAPVIAPEIKQHLRLTPELTAGRTDFDPWANVNPYSRLRTPYKRGGEYTVDLPEHLRAFQRYSIADLRGVRDEFGRSLSGPDAMDFRTDHRPPRLKITHPIAVLEKDAPTAMPLYVTNLTDIDYHYRKLTPAGTDSNLSSHQQVDRVWDIAYAAPAKMRELLQGGSGVLSGTLQPHPTPAAAAAAADSAYFDVDSSEMPWSRSGGRGDFFTEVTPFEVHVKLGAYNTLVWVTSLASGAPISQARVRVFRDSYQGLTAAAAVLAEGVTAKDGVAALPGRERLTAAAGGPPAAGDSFMVRVDAGGELALLPLDHAFELDTYRASRGQFWSGYGTPKDHIRAWGTTAQGVYKLGDNVRYKLYLRGQNNFTLEAVAQRTGYQLEIIDPTGKVIKTETGITLSPFGGYDGSFRVPLSGAVGWYDFRLRNAGADPSEWTPMRVLVADFTPAPFQVQNTLNGQLFQPGDSIEVATSASLHAGGPYASAASRVTARLFPQPLQLSDPVASGFEFSSSEPAGDCRWGRMPEAATVHQSAAQVDDKGQLETRFQMPDADMLSAKLEVESAVRDERGKYVATRSYAQYRGRDRFVGLRSDRWTLEQGKPASIEYLVVDQNGAPISGVPVTVTAAAEVVEAARVKGAGDAYLTSFDRRWDEDASCKGESGPAAQKCTFTPHRAGSYSISARVEDTHGRSHTTQLCLWVTGKGRVMWEEPADMSLSLIPEKETYKVGERARYLVKNPFPGARALVTIERFGVIKHWVQTLTGNTPIIEFNVEPDFMPGFYLSVVAMSPRVAPAPGAPWIDADGIDLGRPTYRIGYLKVPVEDPYKTLDVTIKSAKVSYKPRDSVTLQLAAKPHERAPLQPIEFAVVVLDEAVFDLIQDGKNYFDPYRGFYQLGNLDLTNYTLLSRLVGLQKFEKKGANSGGDGGAGFDMRSISNYVAYWNPSVVADKHGAAQVSFILPDNLTGWRVFAIAVTPEDRVGLGDYKFKSSKLTELRPVMPNQLTAGDRVSAGFSVLNRSDKTRTIEVELEARGPIETSSGSVVKSHQTLTLAPFKRETVWLPLTTKADGTLSVRATASDAFDRDALTHELMVNRRVSLDVAASYGTTLSAGVDEALEFPSQMMPGIGTVSVLLTPTVLGNLDGALRYVRDYPYLCWEQRLTKAMLASEYLKLRDYLAPDLLWAQAEVLPQTMLDDAASFQAPNGGMGFWIGDDAHVSPYLSAATALAFNRLVASGYRVAEDVQKRLDSYLERMLRENIAPSFYSEGMVSSVRAVALQALAERNRLSLGDLQRYEQYAPRMDLFGLAAYFNAATRIKGAEALSASLASRILSHANQSGGQFHFTELLDDGYSQILSTPMRSECAILSAFLRYGETAAGAQLVGDVPFKLVRSVTQSRGSRDHWENTQENLYCASALAQYAAIYETEAPSLITRVSLDGKTIGEAKFAAHRDPPVMISRRNGDDDAGHKAVVHIERTGTGRLYYSTRLSYSLNDLAAKEYNAGMEVHREYSVQRAGRWQLLPNPLEVRRGELVRIDLYLSVPAARHFVVVDDPVPGGLEPVNRELATASTVDADETSFTAAGGSFWFRYADWSEYGISMWNFYHRELNHDAARFYADYLPAGHYHLSYGAQAMAEGEFTAAPARAEEMYDPDVYGKGLPALLRVGHE